MNNINKKEEVKDEIKENDWLYTYRTWTTTLPKKDLSFIAAFKFLITPELLLNAWIYFRQTNTLVQERYGECDLSLPSNEVIEFELQFYDSIKPLFEEFINRDKIELKNCGLLMKFILSKDAREIDLWRIPACCKLPHQSPFLWTYPPQKLKENIEFMEEAKLKEKEQLSSSHLKNANDFALVLYERGYETSKEWSDTIRKYIDKLLMTKDPNKMESHELTTLHFFKQFYCSLVKTSIRCS